MNQEAFFCELCQNSFAIGQKVELDDRRALPICDLCWNQVPIGDRLKFLAEVRRNQTIEKVVDTLIVWMAEKDRDRDPFGMN